MSSDFIRKGSGETERIKELHSQARRALYTGGSFFKISYFFLMFDLALILAYAHWVLGVIGFTLYVIAWAYLYWKTGPYPKTK